MRGGGGEVAVRGELSPLSGLIRNSLCEENFTSTFVRKKRGNKKNLSSVLPRAVAASTQ